MNVLSLDLDFFIHGTAHNRPDSKSKRPDDLDLTPWSGEEVTRFLNESLHVPSQIPGRVLTSHHEVFYAWRDAIDKKLLATPFFVCHVDAHSDLGMGFSSWTYLHGEFLSLSLDRRRRPKRGRSGLNFGSFMPFAIGNRWISNIDFIASESWMHDIPAFLLSDKSYQIGTNLKKPPASLEIELMYAGDSEINDCIYGRSHFKDVRQRIGEPVVPFEVLDAQSITGRYSDRKWDFLFLCHSPGYVPTAADPLLQLIAQRITAF